MDNQKLGRTTRNCNLVVPWDSHLFFLNSNPGILIIPSFHCFFKTGQSARDVVSSYIKHFSPVSAGLEQRIVIQQDPTPTNKQHDMIVNGVIYAAVALGIIVLVVVVYKVYTRTKRSERHPYQKALLKADA